MRLDEKFDLDKLFFTSDAHFFHANILTYCNRPFCDVADQTQQLISNWNNIVPEDGNVFMLGDFIHTGDIGSVGNIIDGLNGKIWWILGNHCLQNRHDRQIIKDMVGGRQYDVVTLLLKNDNNNRIFMSHYPHLYWPRGCYHVHGHIHSGPGSTSSEVAPFHPLRYDVGVDNNDYTPVSYHRLMSIFDEQKAVSM